MFVSCENDMERINEVTYTDDSADRTLIDATILYSDDGLAIARLESVQIDYFEGAAPYMETPNGLTIFFYDSTAQNIESTLTANYGRYNESEQIFEVKDNVVIETNKNEVIKSEYLVWRRNWPNDSAKVFTDQGVRIIREDATIHFDTLRSFEDFSWYEGIGVTGIFTARESADSTETR